MVVITYVAVLAAVWKILDIVKYATRSNIRATVTQLLAFGLGIGAAFVMGAADLAKAWDVGAGIPLTDMDGWSKVVLGIIWGGGASAAYDLKRAFDSSDSAQVPSLPIRNPDEPRAPTTSTGD